MKNVTISLDEGMLEASRRFAQENGLSLNELIRKLLSETIRPAETDWLQASFLRADQQNWRSTAPWKREDAYDPKRIR